MERRSDIISSTEWAAAKLRWQLALLCDTSLSDSARILGALLMHDFDERKGGYAWRGQGRRKVPGEELSPDVPEDSLSARAGKHVRTIQLAAKELETAGYIEIERGRGRGHSNRYWPKLEKANPAPPYREERQSEHRHLRSGKAAPAPPFSHKKAVPASRNGSADAALPLKYSNSPPLPPDAPQEGDAALLAGAKRMACAVPEPLIAADRQTRETLAKVLERLRAREGDRWCASRFYKSDVWTRGSEVVLVAGTDWALDQLKPEWRMIAALWLVEDTRNRPLKLESPDAATRG